MVAYNEDWSHTACISYMNYTTELHPCCSRSNFIVKFNFLNNQYIYVCNLLVVIKISGILFYWNVFMSKYPV